MFFVKSEDWKFSELLIFNIEYIQSSNTPKSKEDKSSESESIHYINAIEAILFFDDKILTYFIEEANSMLPVEAEFQFTKIIIE